MSRIYFILRSCMMVNSVFWKVGIAAAITALAGEHLRADSPWLKDAFADDFLVGTALGTAQIMGEEPAALELSARQFNAITPENCLKWAEVHPEPDEFDFEPADKYVAWGEENGMFIVGH